MKTIKIILIMFFLLLGGIVMSQTNWQISTEKYNGSEYTIKRGKYVCAVTNKKYAFEEMTLDIEKDGETAEAYAKRREPLYQKLYDVTKEALDFDNIFVLRRNNRLSMDCYFDSKTKNYVGAKFVFTEGLV
ncbi:MAG: hypothetical protein LBR48_00005, partial [Dysgonamonadaceae bacterium]|nr:hypothetical protein [Dysgonamonadaceae bacterium]